ncbi:wall-associated receptor kinase 2-like [Eucalyptus grandis]|uniref:wall-associated receptor kinase 2-like n=1 Tax=Eucalyptus grandis TaxID=71139 RepID=UPI00192ECDEE|nr:wall-associated receptor kinase 2-like [Eucalyptus grandis]
MKIVRHLLLVAVAWWLRQGGAPTVAGHCARRCGSMPIPYPFGLERQCVRSEEFLLHCNKTEGRGGRLLLGNYSIRRISVSDSTMVIRLPELNDCYNESGSPLNTSKNLYIDLSSYSQYRFSATRNALTVLGCDTFADMNMTAAANKDNISQGGCSSSCNEDVDLAYETTCSGIGCCQASILRGLDKLQIRIGSFNNRKNVFSFNPCGVAFVGDRESFNVSSERLPTFNDLGKRSDLVLDWMIGWDVTCAQAKSNQSSYACVNNSTHCNEFADGPGYRCFCKPGYEGNPYNLSRGCQDINECEDPQKHSCRGKCKNLPGNYTCEVVDNRRNIVVATSITWKWRIRKINFRKNGGKLLKHPTVRIFTEAELAKATNNYDESKKLGEGGFGSVYRGRIAVDMEIVVKKPKDVHKPLMKNKFQDKLKIVILKNRKNVVKLHGICLETRIPLLVYEYILNGTLFKHIHPKVSTILSSWKNRLRIAVEAAVALKEMHFDEIIHGNIKSANILLDQNYSVKISDFGTSVLMSPEHSHIVATEIGGTLGYIDPEYLTTGKLTIKSDVYSFGAVLMELLTEKEPTTSVTDEFGDPINIIPHFILSVKKGTLSNVINFEAASEDEINQVETVAKIAVKCLNQSSRKRPTMGEVDQQLAPINQSSMVAENI